MTNRLTKHLLLFIVCFAMMASIAILTKTLIDLRPAANNSIVTSITREIPELARDGQPLFDIKSITRVGRNWYVITIASNETKNSSVSVKLALLKSGAKLKIVLGPDTYSDGLGNIVSHFPEIRVPESVIIELQKS